MGVPVGFPVGFSVGFWWVFGGCSVPLEINVIEF